jgi:hypothetical protein
VNGPKGWLLTGYDKSEWLFAKGPNGPEYSGLIEKMNDAFYHCSIESQLVNNFWLPKTVTFRNFAYVAGEFTAEFSGYKVNN